MWLDGEGDQDDILAGLLAQQLLQLGDLCQCFCIVAQFSVLHGGVCNQGNFLAGLAGFAVKVNGELIEPASDGTYTILKVKGPISATFSRRAPRKPLITISP